MVSALNRESAEIEYHGIRGDSLACREAVFRLVQYGSRITDARILTSGQSHSLLLSISSGDMVAIQSGFASGYGGLGPTTFSEVLGVLHAVGAEIDEYEVNSDIIKRINETALTTEDIRNINSSRAIRPQRWRDYVLNDHWTDHEIDVQWHRFPQVIPFALVDRRIMDLAIAFWEGPDDALMKGYRRLEDIIRKRTDSENHGSRLLDEAFSLKRGKLKWMDAPDRAHAGRLDLMKGTFGAYRNVRAHRDSETSNDADLLAEFLLLNHLYRLERKATEVDANSDNSSIYAV